MGRSITVTAENPGFTIAPVHIVPKNKHQDPQTLLEAIQTRQQHLFYKRAEDYTRFERVCAWLAFRREGMENWDIPYVIALFCSGVATGVYLFMGVIERVRPGHLDLQLELPMLVKALACSLPLVAWFATAWKTRDWKQEVLPLWLRSFHARKASEFNAIATEEGAFNAWARTARIPAEMQEEVTASANERRRAIHDRMLVYLSDMDKVLRHREEVVLMLESRRAIDAAFPAPDSRVTMALAPRVAMLKSAEALLEEAGQLGMPTDELLAVRQLTSGS